MSAISLHDENPPAKFRGTEASKIPMLTRPQQGMILVDDKPKSW
jgi:hypothetical protein